MADLPTRRYDLSLETINQLCRQFLMASPNQPATHFGCYILDGMDKFSDLGRYIEGKIFNETFKNDPRIMLKEYQPYDKASTFLIVIDHQIQMPVGVMRIIKDSKAGLKSLIDLKDTPLEISARQFYEAYQIKPSGCIDIATIAVERGYRGRTFGYIPSLLLYRALYTQILTDPKVQAVVAIIDEKPYKLLLALGMPFKPIFNSRPFTYLSSDISYALWAKTEDFLPSVRQQARQYRWTVSPSRQYLRRMMLRLMDGQGLDHMMGYLR